MDRRTLAAILGATWLIVVVRLAVTCAPAAARGSVASHLTEQAAEAREFTEGQARLLRPQWTASQIKQYGQAVEAGVLSGATADLDAAAVADLHAGVTYLLEIQPESLEPARFAKACADYCSWLVETMLSRPSPTETQRVAVRHQIDEIAQLVEKAVARRSAAITDNARSAGIPFESQERVVTDAVARFRSRAVAMQGLAISPLFKSPLSSGAMKELRAELARLSLPEKQQTLFSYAGFPVLTLADPRDVILLSLEADSALAGQAALVAVWQYSAVVPRDLLEEWERAFEAHAEWLRSRR